MFLNIMFHAPMGRFQLESKLELSLFAGFTVLPFNQLCSFLQAFHRSYGIFDRSCWVSKFFLSPGLGSCPLEFKSKSNSKFYFLLIYTYSLGGLKSGAKLRVNQGWVETPSDTNFRIVAKAQLKTFENWEAVVFRQDGFCQYKI